MINDHGTVAVYTNFRNTAGGFLFNDDKGISLASIGNQGLFIREGQTDPNNNGTFLSLNNATEPVPLQLNSLNQLSVGTRLTGTSGGSNDDHSIVQSTLGVLTEIARENGATPTIGQYGSFSLPVGNDIGGVAFIGSNLRNSGTSSKTIVVDSGGSAVEVARIGQAAPDGNGHYEDFTDDIDLNNFGQVAFRTSLGNTTGGPSVDNFAIVRSDGTDMDIVFRAGDASYDGNGTVGASFPTFGAPMINDWGSVVATIDYDNTANGPLDESAIVFGNPGLTQPVTHYQYLREGDAAPDGNGVYSHLSDVRGFNQADVVVFEAELRNTSGGVTSPDQYGIFLSDGHETIQVVRGGDVIDDFTVTQLTGNGLGIIDSSFNDHGQLVYRVKGRVNGELTEQIMLYTPDLHWRDPGTGYLEWDDRGHVGEIGTNATRNSQARRNFTLSLVPGPVHNVILDRDVSAFTFNELLGPAADTTVRSLTIGARNGLALQAGMHFTATEGISIHADRGSLTTADEVSGDIALLGQDAELNTNGTIFNGNIENNGIVLSSMNTNMDVYHSSVINNFAFTDGSPDFHGNFTNNGEINVESGGHYEFFGNYFGPGQINNDGSVTFHGGFFPGASPVNAEVTGTGNINLSSTATTVMEIGGTVRGAFHGDPLAEYDSLNLVDGGTLTLAGVLELALISPDGSSPVYTPMLGDIYTLFTAGSIIGEFDSISLPELSEGFFWVLNRDGQSFSYSVSAVPLPGAGWLLLSACCLFHIIRRRG